jgi:hypothetical protein
MRMLKFALHAASLMSVGAMIAGLMVAGPMVAGTAYAVNLPAENASGLVLHSTLGSVTGENSGIGAPAGEVQPGGTFVITGECVAQVKSADNLRVVLTFADSNPALPGYRSVVPTDQKIDAGGLAVTVPDLPEAANRVFSVKVFRLGAESPEMCNAGSIRIGSATHGKLG